LLLLLIVVVVVLLLQGMYYQAAGKPAQAQQLYEEILADQQHDATIPKQLVSRECGLAHGQICMHFIQGPLAPT
jgi:hypothetical protein